MIGIRIPKPKNNEAWALCSLCLCGRKLPGIENPIRFYPHNPRLKNVRGSNPVTALRKGLTSVAGLIPLTLVVRPKKILLPLAVLAAGWILSAWMYVLLHRAGVRREETFFDERVAEAQAAIRLRMTAYTDALRGGTSFIGAAAAMDREQWRVFAESLQLPKRYPGINGLGVILSVPPDGLAAWRDLARVPGEPEPNVMPFPASTPRPGDPQYLITYLEGNVGATAPIGRNIGTDPSRRAAAEQARDSGEPQINQRIPGSRDTERRSGLILYMPFYAKGAKLATVADRRAAHLGWVYAQVYPDVFLNGVLGPLGQALRVDFFESGGLDRGRLMYSSVEMADGPLPAFERVTDLELAGQHFQLGWRRGPKFPEADKSSALLAAASCALATLLLAGLVVSLQSTGRRANRIAEERTVELKASEERYRHARDAALESSRLKSEFLSNMSHEIRTPMNAIVGMSGLIAGTQLDPAQREMLRVVQDGADQLLVVIDDILDFSRVEAGKLRLDANPFDLTETIRSTVALLAPRAAQKKITLETDLALGAASSLVGDAGRIRQILTNLLGNAIKFTDRGKVRVAATVMHESPDRVLVRLSVQDTGIGIAPAVQRRLFQPFTQADGSTTRTYGGSGLGLAISRQLAELMGGTIGVESELGHGSTFWVQLELARHHDAPPASDPFPPATGLKPLRLLVVEDDPTNQLVAQMLLTRMGHTVDIAPDGPTALARLEKNRYDAVFMDCQMPGFDGFETTRRIRSGKLAGIPANIPIIALTAYATSEARASCLESGMTDHVSKPILPEEIDAALLRCGFSRAT